MIESIQGVFEQVTLFDYIYLVLTILFIIQGTSKGFVLSILSAAKWVLAYVITIYVFPKVKPYVEDIIDNEYVLDVILGIGIFIIIIFIILLINKALTKAVSYSGIGTIDKVFGFFFRVGFLHDFSIHSHAIVPLFGGLNFQQVCETLLSDL